METLWREISCIWCAEAGQGSPGTLLGQLPKPLPLCATGRRGFGGVAGSPGHGADDSERA